MDLKFKSPHLRHWLTPCRAWLTDENRSSRVDFIACHWPRRCPFYLLNLNHTYEKICLGINHRSNRHRVHGFLHATRGDIRGDTRKFGHIVDSPSVEGRRQLQDSEASADHRPVGSWFNAQEEEGQGSSVTFTFAGIRVAFADSLKARGSETQRTAVGNVAINRPRGRLKESLFVRTHPPLRHGLQALEGLSSRVKFGRDV
jgi:hypothetical protein